MGPQRITYLMFVVGELWVYWFFRSDCMYPPPRTSRESNTELLCGTEWPSPKDFLLRMVVVSAVSSPMVQLLSGNRLRVGGRAKGWKRPQMGGQIRRGWIWRFWGAPIFRPEVPKYLFLKGFGTSGRKIGAPQKRQIQPRRIWPPICGNLPIPIRDL